MRVRVAYTVEVDDDMRRRINASRDRAGLATHHEVREWYEAHGRSMDDDLQDPDAGWDT